MGLAVLLIWNKRNSISKAASPIFLLKELAMINRPTNLFPKFGFCLEAQITSGFRLD